MLVGNYFEFWDGACIAAVEGVATNLMIANNALLATSSAACYVNVHSSSGGPNDRVVVSNNRLMRLGLGDAAPIGINGGYSTNLMVWGNLATDGGAVLSYQGYTSPTSDWLAAGEATLGVVRLATGVVTLTDASAISVDAGSGSYFVVTLGGNRTVAAPSNPVLGQRISFLVKQDASGGRTLSWNGIFRVSWSNSGNSANKSTSVSFVFDGSYWNQDGAQVPYHL